MNLDGITEIVIITEKKKKKTYFVYFYTTGNNNIGTYCTVKNLAISGG